MTAIAVAATYNIATCPVDASDWTAMAPVAEVLGPTCGRFIGTFIFDINFKL
jgi:hypothetical protein